MARRNRSQLTLRMVEVTGEGEAGTRAALEFFQRGLAAQADVDELVELCWCGHVRCAHGKTGACTQLWCECKRFGKAVG